MEIDMTTKAKFWIAHNPGTGSVKPWEVWFQADGHKAMVVSSSSHERTARRSMAKAIERNATCYDLSGKE